MKRFRSECAFSLVELLVACLLFMLLAVALLSAFTHIASSYQGTQARADTFREGRAALQLMERDLKTMVPHSSKPSSTNTMRTLQIESTPNPFVGFLARIPPNAQPAGSNPSDVCIVGYFLDSEVRDDREIPSLYRILIPSSETFTRLTSGSTNPLNSADRSASTPYTEPIATHVTSFEVKALDSTLMEIANPMVSTNIAYVEISFELIGSRVAQSYFQTGLAQEAKDRLLDKEARVFSLRYKIP